MKYALFSLIIVFAICSISVNAVEESFSYCLNSSHKYWEANIYYNNDLDSWNDTINCTYGCEQGSCLPKPSSSGDIAVVIGLLLPAFFLIFIAFKLAEKHIGLQLLFIMFSLYFIFLNTAYLGSISTQNGISLGEGVTNAAHLLSSLILWIVPIYLVIWLIYEMLVKFDKIEPFSFSVKEDD